ncbi:MAG: LysR family transcriptional regulator [Thioalkalispiraceae bacterium]|jgi:DNA-binding transcriptional LysR family regulator
MMHSRTSLEQWRAFQAVIDYGGFAQAARALHRSQSAISYAVNRLQEQLGVRLLEIEGRKAHLTEMGQVLLERSRHLVNSASELEQLAQQLEQGWEAEVSLAVDAAFPMAEVFQALKTFSMECQGSRVLLNEVVLSGAGDALRESTADLVIGANLPAEYLSDPLLDIEFIAVAHASHPLHALPEPLTRRQLSAELQIIIRDSGHTETQSVGWQNTEQRWIVSNIDTAIESISHGLGFAWLPKHKIINKLRDGVLKPLPLREGRAYYVSFYMAYGQPEQPGPATRLLAEKIRNRCAAYIESEQF